MQVLATQPLNGHGDEAVSLPLSPAQEGLWFMQRLEPLSTAYHLARAFHLRGPLDVATLEQALNVVRARQAVLRTRFIERDGEPLQVAGSHVDVRVPMSDLSAHADDERDAALSAALAHERQQPFDLAADGAARLRIFRMSADWHVLSVVVHHLVSDGGSNAIFARELADAYGAIVRNEASTARPALTWQYADFAGWQRAERTSDKGRADLAWWTGYLGARQDVFELPADFVRTAASERTAHTHTFTLKEATVAAVRARCKAERCTPFVALMAAWQLLLSRHSGRDDFCIGVPTSGRLREECEDLIGLFVDTQVYRARLHPSMTGRALLDAVRSDTRAALDHNGVTLAAVVDALGVRREAGRHPLFQTLFNVQGASAAGALSLEGLDVEIVDFESPAARFDLSFDVRIATDAVTCTARYDSSLYRAETIARLGRHYEALLVGLCDAPERPVAGIEFIDEDELAQLSVWSAAPARYELFAGVHELFSREAGRHPSAVALLYGEAVLTYGELESRANRLAHFLIGQGVGPEVRVGIGVERSVEMVVGLLAILKAGGAYVPLDPEYPAERLAYMCEDSGIALLLTQHALRARFDAHVADRCAVVELDTLDTSMQPSTLPSLTVHPEQLAYVIYTSGSTGRPKGAANRHGALHNRLAWMQQAYGLDATDTVLQKTPFSFDVSVWEFFWPLMTGARLAVAAPGDHREPARLVELIDRHQVTTLHFVPPMLQAFVSSLDEGTTCSSLRRVICSGEALPATLQDRTLERLPHVQLYNLYGPTEAAIDVTHWTCRAGDATVPIGRPIGNVTTHVLDASMNRVPVGVAGELYLGGAGLARGYLKRAGLTAERFVPDPFIAGSRLYRTGDLARWRTDGALEYLGRLDHQVKVRGFRIELGEIEAALQTLEGIGEAVVVTQMGPGGARLVGYVTARAGATLEPKALETGLKAKLPEYMVPSVWVELEKLPLSPNGKVERRALPAPETAQEQEHEAPQGEVETALAQVWESVLRVERVSRHANFFELGGDSILSLQIVERARRAGWKVTPRQLFERQTVSQLAGVVQRVQEQAQHQSAQGEVPLLPIQAQFFEQVQQQRHHWNQAVLLRSSEEIDAQVLEQALRALIDHHDALRLRFTQDDAGQWVQAYAQTETEAQTQPDLLWIREAKDVAEIEAHSEAAQRSLDLTNGPLLRAVLMRIADGSTRLLLVIHHLVVDGVSWRILLEDLQTVSAQIQRGEAIALPARTDSYQRWSQQLQQYAQSDALREQQTYWEKVNRTPATLPCDMPEGTNRVADRQQATLKLDSTQTQRLLQQAPAAYRTQVNDLLLTALGRALCGWTGQERIRLDLEGHGREDVFEGTEISRTVGWFTSVYPVSLEPAGELGEAVKRVKEGLRAVPQRGLGYGVLNNVAHTIKQTEPSQVIFNYLGQLDGSFSESSTWQPAKESPGRSQDDSAPLVYALSVNGRVLDDALTLTINYSNKRYNEQTIEALLTAYHTELTQLIDHCTSGETGASGATPSDFELAALTQPELDALPLALHNVAEIYPLSPMQSGMLFHTLYSPDRSVYLNQLRADIDGLDVERFRAAWVEVAARHDILRTAFVPQGEGWLQWVARSVDVPFVEHDWRDRNAAAHNALDELANRELAEGFDVTRAPLQRVVLIRTGEQRHHFVWTHHHVLMDGWSVSQLLGEVLRHYSGQRLPAHGGRYRDYIGWLQTRDTHASEVHWRRQLERLDEPTYLVDAVRRGQPACSDEAKHAAHTLELDPTATARLVAFARHERVTVNTLVQAAWALLLHRYTQQPSVVFGATLAGRPAELPGVSHLLGLFINTLPVIAEPRAGMRLGDWLRDLQQQGLAAQEHAHTPLYDIQRWAGSHGQSLFDTVVVFENYPVDEALKEASPGGLSIANVRASDETSYALTLGVVQSDTLKLDYRFARNAFADDEIAGIAQQTAALLNAFAAADATNRPLGDLALLDEKQQRALISLGEHQATMHPAQKQPVPALIEAHAQQQPDAVALLCGDVALSYGELNERANRLAHRLIRLGVSAEVRVGFAVERSVDMIVGLLAVLKAGGAYVPLDPAYPAERLAHMIDDSGIGLLLTQSHLHARVPVPAQLACVDLDTLDVSAEPSGNPLATLHDDQLAYVIYTSGSTGKPKGVAVAHGALSMHCQAIAARYGITAADRQLHFSSISFDAAGEQWLVPLISGASVVLRDDSVWAAQRLADEIATKQITVLDLPPAYANAFAQEIEPGAVSVKTCIVGGEGWSRSGFEIVQRNLRPERIFNAYGPSETVITSTVWQADPSTECTGIYAPIGTPVGERRAYVLDPALALVPQGVVGELYLGGTGLARGYLNRAALTAERFVPDPFDAHGGRLYRTGDLVRWNRAGELEYVGRTDEQVKVRGFRIEPGEIEATLLAQDGVREAAVVVREVAGAPRLAAFVAAQSGTTLDAAALKAALAERLPDHMVPASIVILDALPVTPNGKLDRRALPASEPAATQAYEAPQGELEETVARIWADVLGVERVGRGDNFFELGGDSIFSLRVQRRIAQQLAVDIELAALFAAPTLEAFSVAVAAAQSRATAEPDRLTDEMQSILSELMQ